MKKLYSSISHMLFDSRPSRFLGAIIVCAFLIRLGAIIVAGNPEHPQMYEHGFIAHNLYHGHGFSMHWPYLPIDSIRQVIHSEPPKFEGAFLPPLNPYLIYLAYQLFGETSSAALALMLFYAIISSFIPLAVYKTAMLIGSERSARLSSMIALLFLPAAIAVTTYSGSPLYQLLGVVILYYSIQSVLTHSRRSFMLLGICCGIMTFLRSEFFLFGFLLILLAVFIELRRGVKTQQLVQHLFAAALLFTAIIAPWTIRNFTLFHRFVPVLSHPWYEMWRGNNPQASGTTWKTEGYAIWPDTDKFPQIVHRMDAIPYNQETEVNIDTIFKAEVIDFIKNNPGRFLFLGLKKITFLFTTDFNYPGATNPLYFLPMVVVSALTLLGLLKLFRSPDSEARSAAILYSAFLFFYIGLTVMTVMIPRYQIYIFTVSLPLTGLFFKENNFHAK